jgi:hypothetical protein
MEKRSVAASLLVLLFLLGCAEKEYPLKTREEALPADAAKMTPDGDWHPPVLHSGEWENPAPLGDAINTRGAEDSPFITPDGDTLYFFFTPDVRVPPEKQLLDGATGIYASKKTGDAWGAPERVVLQDPGKLALDGCAFVQGNSMWFCSAREGHSGVRLFAAEFRGGRWQGWRYLGDELFDNEVGEMHITPDGKELYFHSSRSGGQGQLDIWVSEKEGEGWGEPLNVLAVNTGESEGWPFISADGGELWFTRFHLGSPAIFRSKKIQGGWSEPELIVSSFAGEPSLDSGGNLYFVHHFYEDGKMIEADIYFARRK